MKNKILLLSASTIISACIVSITTALFIHDANWALRLSTVSGTLCVGSIGLFFVGTVFPK